MNECMNSTLLPCGRELGNKLFERKQ